MSEPTKQAGWSTVALGDVVRQVKDKVDPEESGLDRYVAGEHMDTDDLRIRRWGEVGDDYLGPAFHMRFKPGQVLYGSRRTYLRKVALAEFEGITANTTYVLESKDSDVLLPELLPFLMQTEAVNAHSVRESKGSVNPYVNFSDLAWYEFPLPPPAEQRRIVEALQAAERVLEALRQLKRAADTALESFALGALVGFVATSAMDIETVSLPTGWRLRTAKELVSAPVVSGTTPRGYRDGAVPECPFIKVGDLSFDGSLNYGPDGGCVNPAAFAATESVHVVPGDILTNIVGPPLGKVSVVPGCLEEALINQAIVRYRMPDEMFGRWTAFYLMSDWAKQWLFARSKKTSGQRNLNSSTCAELPVPIPPTEALTAKVDQLTMFEKAGRASERRIRQGASLKSALLRTGLKQ